MAAQATLQAFTTSSVTSHAGAELCDSTGCSSCCGTLWHWQCNMLAVPTGLAELGVKAGIAAAPAPLSLEIDQAMCPACCAAMCRLSRPTAYWSACPPWQCLC